MAHHAPRDPDYLSNTVTGILKSSNVTSLGGDVAYSVILPQTYDDGNKKTDDPYPLVISLHPGMADRDHLIDPKGAARTGRDVLQTREVVWASFSCEPPKGMGNYMDRFDGSDRWIRFVVDDFIPFIEGKFNCGGQQKYRYMTGICMGGYGALKFAFKYPDLFAAIAAQQAAMPVGVSGKDLPYNDMMNGPLSGSDHDLASMYGAKTFAETDDQFFRENISPIAMAIDNADNIRRSKLKLYIDVGDEDMIGLQNASELLHRVLWSLRIRHEYHLVLGADHTGSSWRRRGPEAMEFLWRAMDNAIDPRPVLSDPAEEAWIHWVRNGKTGPEPALDNKDDFVAGAGVFSDKTTQGIRAQVGLSKGGDNDVTATDGPEEIMGYKWRNKSKTPTPEISPFICLHEMNKKKLILFTNSDYKNVTNTKIFDI